MPAPTTLYEYYTSQGKALPSLSERSNLYQQYGLGSASSYGGTAEQNTALLTKLTATPSASPVSTPAAPPAPTTPTPTSPTTTPTPPIPGLPSTTTTGVATSDPIRNAETQQKTAQQLKDAEEEATLVRLTRQKAIADLQTATAGSASAPNLVETYKSLRAENGIADIETELSSVKTKRTELQQSLQQLRDQLSGQGRTSGEVDTGVGVKAKEVQAQLDALNLRESTLVDQYNTKNNVISTMMDLTQKDYANAKADYDKAYSSAITAINAVKGLRAEQQAEEDKAADNARANLQIMFNQITSGGMSLENMSPAQKAQINSLELQAGLPVGTIDTFAKLKPKANLISTSQGVDANGNDIISLVYADENGNPGVVRTVKTGGKSKIPGSSEGTATERENAAKAARISQVASSIEAVKRDGKDGAYVPGAAYRDLYTAYVSQNPGKGKEFLDEFPVELYIAPGERRNFKQ